MLWRVCDLLVEMGRLDEAEAGLGVGLDLARQGNNLSARVRFLEVAARAKDKQGRPAEALAALDEALEVCTTYRDKLGQFFILEQMAPLLRRLDRQEEALRAFQRMARLGEETQDRVRQALSLVGVGQMLKELGRTEEGRQILNEARQVYLSCGQRLWADKIAAEIEAWAEEDGDPGEHD